MPGYVIANWKMHKTVPEARDFVCRLKEMLPTLTDREVVIAPPFTALFAVAGMTVGTSIKVSAQNLHWEEKGAFTGEVSAAMVADCGCEYVIVGHSERRTIFGETDEMVNRKVRTAIANGLKPVICVGETLAERESDATFTVIATQVKEGLKGIAFDGISRAVLAYEPVWAIGTGKRQPRDRRKRSTGSSGRALKSVHEGHSRRPADTIRRQRPPGQHRFPDGRARR